jgi:AbrB family looped-hinge helix DNA binding protein
MIVPMSLKASSPQALPSKLTPENRATVPAAVRAALGAKAGDRLLFLVDGDDVRVVRAASLVHQLWANNHGGDAGDSVEDVRTTRERDVASAADTARFEAEEDDTRSDEEVAADLLGGLGLQP